MSDKWQSVYINESIYIGSYIFSDNEYHYESITGMSWASDCSYTDMYEHLVNEYEAFSRSKSKRT